MNPQQRHESLLERWLTWKINVCIVLEIFTWACLAVAVVIYIVMLCGCAARPAHPYIDPKAQVYGPPQWHCDLNNNCSLVQMGEPSQLTPVGCFLNQWTIGLGKKAEECKKPKKAKK